MKKTVLIALPIAIFVVVACQLTGALFDEKGSCHSQTKAQLQQISLDEKFKILRHYRWGGYTKLMCALEMKLPLDEVKQLILEGEDVNACEAEMIRAYKPVLRYAIDRGSDKESAEIIRLLLDSGADSGWKTYNRVEDEKTYGFMTLFHYAVIYSSPEIVQIFIDFGADVNHSLSKHSGIENPRTPLESAKLLNRRDIEQVLKRAGAIEKRITECV